MKTRTDELTRARLRVYAGLALAALCPAFNLVVWPFFHEDSWLVRAFFMGSAAVALAALVGLVAATRRRSRLLVLVAALVAVLVCLPSVLTVAVRLTIRASEFGEMLISIAEGGADAAGARVLVLATAVPIALLVDPVPVVLLYLFARREARLLKQPTTGA